MIEDKPKVNQSLMNRLLEMSADNDSKFLRELVMEEVPCGVRNCKREQVIRRHEAAACIQAHWRGTWARKCLLTHVNLSPEMYKCVCIDWFSVTQFILYNKIMVVDYI